MERLTVTEKWTAFVLVYGTVLTVLSPSSVAPVLPLIAQSFSDHENIALLARMVMTLPTLLMAFSAPLSALIARRVGKVRVFRYAIFLYAIAAPVGLFNPTLEILLLSRALVGLALGASMPMAIALIGDFFPGEKRIRVMGAQSSVQELSTVTFSVLAGLLGAFGWTAPFALFLLASPLVILAFTILKEPTEKGVGGPPGAEAAIESISVPSIAGAYLLGTFGMICLFLVPIHGPFLAAAYVGVGDTFLISLVFGALTLAAGISAANYARLRRKLSVSRVFALCFLVVAAGYLVIANAGLYSGLVAGAAIAGAGIGLFLPNINLVVVNMGPPRHRGLLVSGLMSSIFLGQFFSPIVTTNFVVERGADVLFTLIALVCMTISACFFISASRAKQAGRT